MDYLRILLCLTIFIGHVYSGEHRGIDLLWLGGGKTANVTATTSWPGSRTEHSFWFSDSTRNAYLFGGLSFDEKTKKYDLMNDIWEFDVASHKWKEIKPVSENNPSPRYSSSVCGVKDKMMVVYGGVDSGGNKLNDTWLYSFSNNAWEQLGKSAKESFIRPSSREGQTTWCLNDQMIIFGGRDSENKLYHDMWFFSLVHLEWNEMESSKKYPKNSYGPDIIAYPKPRNGAIAFTGSNKLYLFGGNTATIDSGKTHINGKYVTDLWMYDIKEDSWQKIGGNDAVCQPGLFTHIHAENKANWPGCRIKGTGWIDSRGNLWMFGGEGADATQESVTVFKPGKLLNDLWQYDFTYGMWIWRGGNKYGNTGGNYGDSSSELSPGSRTGFASFNEQGNYHYIYGGIGHDTNGRDGLLSDLWQIDIHMHVVYGMYPSIGGVFMIIFGASALILLIVALSLYNRKFFKFSESEKLSNTEYSVLHNMDDHE